MTILSGKARVAGITGWPVAHSRSPRLHGFWLARHGIDGVGLWRAKLTDVGVATAGAPLAHDRRAD